MVEHHVEVVGSFFGSEFKIFLLVVSLPAFKNLYEHFSEQRFTDLLTEINEYCTDNGDPQVFNLWCLHKLWSCLISNILLDVVVHERGVVDVGHDYK